MFEGDSLNVVHGFHNILNDLSYFGMELVDCNSLSFFVFIFFFCVLNVVIM